MFRVLTFQSDYDYIRPKIYIISCNNMYKEVTIDSIENNKFRMNQSGKRELTNSRNSCDDLTKLELVEDGGLTSSIKTYHQNSHFPLRKKPAKQFRKAKPHL